MNKQEVIEKIEELKKHSCGALGDDWISLGIDKALNVVKQLDEPKKPVVPQYVADFYESIKDNFEYNLYRLCIQYKDNSDELSDEIWAWFDDSDNESLQTLNKMKLFGYEVEKEKLYTVEIPNPNGSGYSKIYLAKNKDSGVELFTWSGYTSIEFADNWKQEENAQLTESEIKKDFDWAWQFKEEVKE